MDKRVKFSSKGTPEMINQATLFELGKNVTKPNRKQQNLPYKRIRDEYWDFKTTPASIGIYGIHPYPAMLHFLVVRELLQGYSKEGDTILDPFMGSGVVAGECLINNRNFIGYDINPLAVLIAKVRTTPIPTPQLLNFLNLIEENYYKNLPEAVEFHNIHYWFEEDIIKQLSKLRKSIFCLEEEDTRDFFNVAFSETVRKVSKTKYNEFKLLRRKSNNANSDAMKVFKEISLSNIGLLTEFYRTYKHKKMQIVLENKNIFEASGLEDSSIDLVITSPPYGDSKTTVAYGQFSRLSLRWLGLEENVDKTSLGSKPKDIIFNLPSKVLYEVLHKIVDKDEKRAKEVFSFYDELFRAIQIMTQKVKKNGYVCFVVGNRRVKSEELPTDKISADFFETQGFQHIKTIVRAISNKRMPIENAPSNIKGKKDFTMRYEYIVILKKQI
ncbi:MAG TPA: DNA methyltransferase [Candidatus Hydrogenedens sp.]|nr:DNA methyltransferase [Candidatus Hydrogenedens sp.]